MVTILPVPAFASENVAEVYETVTTSVPMLGLKPVNDTVAESLPL